LPDIETAAQQQMAQAHDGVDRRAYLVAHSGQEITFGLIGLLGLQPGRSHALLRLLASSDIDAHDQQAGFPVDVERRDGAESDELRGILAAEAELCVDHLALLFEAREQGPMLALVGPYPQGGCGRADGLVPRIAQHAGKGVVDFKKALRRARAEKKQLGAVADDL